MVGAFGMGLTALAVVTTGIRAQDIEAAGRINAVQLPASYYQQIRATPDRYEFERALFNRAAPGRTAAFGEVRLPVVLILFSDSPEVPTVARGDVQNSLFLGPSQRGTITEAYLEISRGALTVTGDVYGWARSALSITEVVGTDRGFGPDARIGEYFVDGLNQLDAGIDFSRYDNDGPDGIADSGDDDGYVDVITFEYLEIAASCGGPSIWPHRSRISAWIGAPFVTDDLGANGSPILIQDYITQGATDCSGQGVQDAAVMTHEFGHALGLPDWYHWVDTSIGPFGRRWVLGCWALMAAGSWGCGPVDESRTPFGPTHMIGYSKATLGWLDYMEIGEVWNEEIVLDAVETSGAVLRLPLDDSGTEFLLAEYRALSGFDAQLPGAGVLLYKHDSQASLRPQPGSGDPYFLTMLEHDANGSLLKISSEGGSRGEIGDAWGVGPGASALNGQSNPSLRRRDGSWSPVMVHEVSVVGDQAHLVVSTGRTPKLVAPTAAFEVEKIRSFRVPVRVAGGRGPYTGVGSLPAGFSFSAVGDELFLVGSMRDDGPVQYSFSVRDAVGSVSPSVTVEVRAPIAWAVDVESLYDALLDSSDESLSTGERDYLDDVGNQNGSYDVGDLRKWLRLSGS
jgi:M6 family metalloprotease-like protein